MFGLFDRRTRTQCISYTMAVMVGVLSLVAHTYAADSIEAHAPSLLKVSLWIMGVLFSLINSLLAWIFVTNVKEIKADIRTIFGKVDHLEEKKLSKEDHDRICEIK